MFFHLIKMPASPFLAVFLLIMCFVISACSIRSQHQALEYQNNSKPQNLSGVLSNRQLAVSFIKPMFSELNCEKQGIVEPGEVDDHFHSLFFYTDKNRDKIIEFNELKQDYPQLSSAQQQQLFAKIDNNADQKIIANEFRDYIIASIHEADINHDDELTEAELNSDDSSVNASQ